MTLAVDDYSVLAVDDYSDVTVTAIGALVHLCPHVDEVDNGTIEITWRVDGKTLELHTLAKYLSRFKDSRLSHEQITDRIAHDLSIEVDVISVTTRWQTAGMEVSCSTSPTLVETP